jgi:hypothetical protein
LKGRKQQVGQGDYNTARALLGLNMFIMMESPRGAKWAISMAADGSYCHLLLDADPFRAKTIEDIHIGIEAKPTTRFRKRGATRH